MFLCLLCFLITCIIKYTVLQKALNQEHKITYK